jgi:hypothetical protein
MKNFKVYSLGILLIVASAGIIIFKLFLWGQNFQPSFDQQVWNVTVNMNMIGKGKRAHARLTLPSETPRQKIYHEAFDHNLSLSLDTHQRTGNRIAEWSTDLLDQNTAIRYSFLAQLKSMRYPLSLTARIPKNPSSAYPEDVQFWLKPSKKIQSSSEEITDHLKKIIGKEKNASEVTRKIYNYVKGEITYQSEKGSKDASQTLDKLTADCGGKARLFVAFSRAAGIPSRIVGGILMTSGVKNTTHVWAENYIEGNWIPFDVVNDHYALLPTGVLELYRGDYALIKRLGVQKFDYFFMLQPTSMLPISESWSLYALPIHFQNSIKMLLLIPLGALVVVFFRVIVGVPTFGTFAPIILALAFRDISLWVGLTCLVGMILLGCVMRRFLDGLRILAIPRVSIIVSMVVILTVAIIIIGDRFGHNKLLFVSLFPIIIITWTIERFSMLQIEDGTFAALKSAAGTTLVAVTTYYIMAQHDLRSYLFTFPEILFAVIGCLLLLGRYTGLRITELWRFRELMKAMKAEKEAKKAAKRSS